MLTKKSIKIIGWVTVVASFMGFLSVSWIMVQQGIFDSIGAYLLLILNVFGTVGAFRLLKGERIGKKLVAIYFAPRLFSVSTPYFFFDFSIGLRVTLNLNLNGWVYQIDVFSVVMFILALRAFKEHEQFVQNQAQPAPEIE